MPRPRCLIWPVFPFAWYLQLKVASQPIDNYRHSASAAAVTARSLQTNCLPKGSRYENNYVAFCRCLPSPLPNLLLFDFFFLHYYCRRIAFLNRGINLNFTYTFNEDRFKCGHLRHRKSTKLNTIWMTWKNGSGTWQYPPILKPSSENRIVLREAHCSGETFEIVSWSV